MKMFVKKAIATVFVSVMLMTVFIGTASATLELEKTPFWVSSAGEGTHSLAFGDIDNDGDLDLAVGNAGRNSIYMNIGGTLETSPSWKSDDSSYTNYIEWGDVNGDGYLDLASANDPRGEIGGCVYLNNEGTLETTPSWTAQGYSNWKDIAWGDVNGDGYLDLAVYNSVYLNNEGTLETTPSWTALDSGGIHSVAWGDVDNDGDLDLATLDSFPPSWARPNKVYLNTGNALETAASIVLPNEWGPGCKIAWGDVDNDGDLDLAAVYWYDEEVDLGGIKIYLNNEGTLLETPYLVARGRFCDIAWGDVDNDGDLDLAAVYTQYGSWVGIYVFENEPTGNLVRKWLLWKQYSNLDFNAGIAWGDVDGDGDLDLAVGCNREIRIFRNIGEHNQPPVADANGPYTGYEGSPITFNGSGSYDSNDYIVSYDWDLDGNGIYETNATATSGIVNHTWCDDYFGNVSLKVTDSYGATDVDNTTVTVNNVAPTVEAGLDQEVLAGATVYFNGSFTDPGWLDTHTIEWNFDDGATAMETLTPTCIYYDKGVYNVTLTVIDDDGGVGTDTAIIIVNPIPANVTIKPETLNLASKGKFTAFITLPEPYNIKNINISTVVCEGAPAVSGHVADDGKYIAKFDREDLRVDLPTGDAVPLTVIGKVFYNGGEADFEGSDTTRVIDKGKGK